MTVETTLETTVRRAFPGDWALLWRVLEPSIREGIWFPIPEDYDIDQTREFWFGPRHEVYVGEVDGEAVWTYYLHPQQLGRGDHVANGAFAVAHDRFGQGFGRQMMEHAVAQARNSGYRAMLLASVLSTNERAVRLYHSAGFADIGTVPGGYRHPQLGDIPTVVMHRTV